MTTPYRGDGIGGLMPFELILPGLASELAGSVSALKASLALLSPDDLPPEARELVAIGRRQVERQEVLLRELAAVAGAEMAWCRSQGLSDAAPCDAHAAAESAVAVMAALAPAAGIELLPAAGPPVLAACGRLALTRVIHCVLVATLARSAGALRARVQVGAEAGHAVIAILVRRDDARPGDAAAEAQVAHDPSWDACHRLAARCGATLEVDATAAAARLTVPLA